VNDSSTPQLRGLLVDWGGVLTVPLPDAVSAWASNDGVDLAHYVAIMRDWFGDAVGREAEINPVHALERGELAVPHFEDRLAAELTVRTGVVVEARGLVARMFAYFDLLPDMPALVRRARESGIRTALLSNSWGLDYPRDGWDDMFDAIIISGEVGMRKPEDRIYRLAAEQVGLAPNECVFVDDLQVNIVGAVEVGMVGVLHREYEVTANELEILFGVPLR
jgi:epoxide hydrolase-like predicted phosphatase